MYALPQIECNLVTGSLEKGSDRVIEAKDPAFPPLNKDHFYQSQSHFLCVGGKIANKNKDEEWQGLLLCSGAEAK